MKKVVGYEEEKIIGRVLVRVESESTPQLMYVTCAHGPLDLVSLNASAVRKQEFDNYLASISRGLQTPLESSTFFKNLRMDQLESADRARSRHSPREAHRFRVPRRSPASRGSGE